MASHHDCILANLKVEGIAVHDCDQSFCSARRACLLAAESNENIEVMMVKQLRTGVNKMKSTMCSIRMKERARNA